MATLSGTDTLSLAPGPASTAQFVPGTTVVGTGSTGDVWSYTIPDATNVIPISSSAAPVIAPNTVVYTTVVVTGTTVVGGFETGVPWSYTIPDATFLSSVVLPVAPTTEPTPSSSVTPSSSTLSPSSTTSAPPPPPPTSTPKDTSALSGGIVAAVLGALLLIILGGATFLCLRLRRRRRGAVDPEKSVGVVWGRGWGRDDKYKRPWRPAIARAGTSGERLTGDPVGSTGDRPRRIKYPYPAPTPEKSNSYTHSADGFSSETVPKRSIPPPSPYVYSPPPQQPERQPALYRSNSPPNQTYARPTSPHGSSTGAPNRLSKQRVTPSASAFLRHMVPTRGASLRRPVKVNPNPPSADLPIPINSPPGPSRPLPYPISRPPNPINSPTNSPHRPPTSPNRPPRSSNSTTPIRPSISTLPSFIRERQFSPGSSETESAIFSSRSSRASSARPAAFTTSRDGLLSPPIAYSRDRYSQSRDSRMTGRSGESRMTGRSGESRMTGRSGESRMTGRSGESRFTSRSGGLGQIVEGRRGWEGNERW